MRLRQLATSQSLMFLASPEAHQSILDVCNIKENIRINSSHVVHWLLEQTCCANEQLQRLYIAQGTDFCDRVTAEARNTGFPSGHSQQKNYLKVLLQPEQQTLEQLYGPTEIGPRHRSGLELSQSPQIKAILMELRDLSNASSNEPSALVASALEEVEQEREVEFQVEEERQIQRPVRYNALKFPGLHPAIREFALTGALRGADGFVHAFSAISQTAVGRKFGIRGTDSLLFVSTEFMRTVKLNKVDTVDNFLVSLVTQIQLSDLIS